MLLTLSGAHLPMLITMVILNRKFLYCLNAFWPIKNVHLQDFIIAKALCVSIICRNVIKVIIRALDRNLFCGIAGCQPIINFELQTIVIYAYVHGSIIYVSKMALVCIMLKS